MRATQPEHDTTGFQIAPMVDIIFILILFFMCSAGMIQTERQLSIALPGTVSQDTPLTMPDEQLIEIMSSGQVMLNGSALDSPTSQEMSELKALLMRYKQSSDSMQTPALATVMPDPRCEYQRIVDVLNACAVARITNVTFSRGDVE